MIGYCDGLGHRAELRYRWTFPIGNVCELCVECCAAWRLNAVRCPSLRPAEIVEIRPGGHILITMAAPKTGTTYTYSGDDGLGACARVADPDISDELPSDMAALDMAPGTEVTVDGYDKDRDLVLVGWVDGAGTPRVTSVDPAEFAAQFTKAG